MQQRRWPAHAGGKVPFDEVSRAAGIDAEEHAQVAKTLELLDSLPAGTEEAVKRQIVMASLRAIDLAAQAGRATGSIELTDPAGDRTRRSRD